MSRILFIALALYALQTPAQTPATLQGRALRQGTSEPVPHARVIAAKTGGPLADYRTAVADESGVFAFHDLTPGVYRIYAERDGYLQAEYGKTAVSTIGTRVTLAAGQTVPDVVVVMTPLAVITGRVFDGGRPVRRVIVRALKPQFSEGRRFFNVVDYTETDDRGEYRLTGLAPGFYFVSAAPKPPPFIEGGSIVYPVTPTILNNNQGRLAVVLSPETLDPVALDPDVLPVVYHPGTTDTASAAPLDVRAGGVVGPIDLTLTHASSFHVRGRVIMDNPGAPIRVQIRQADSAPALAIPGSDIRMDSTFDLPRVPPGRYIVSAQTVDAGSGRMIATVPVTVVDRDVENVSLALRPPVNVNGHLTIDDQPYAGGFPPVVQLQSPTTSGYTAIRYQPDGGFSIPNVAPGEYRFRMVLGNRPLYVETARYGDDDVTDRPLIVDATSRELNVQLSSKTATLDAVALDRQSRPVAGALVIIVPDLARRGRSQLYKTAPTDERGRARLEGLAPGDYRVFATTEIEAAAWQDPEVMRLYEGRGELISVRPSAALTVTLRITP